MKLFAWELGDLNDNDLRTYFQQFGELKFCRVIDGKSYGFVVFKKTACASSALEADSNFGSQGVSHHSYKGQAFKIKISVTKEQTTDLQVMIKKSITEFLPIAAHAPVPL